MEALNGTELEGIAIDISLAKPQSDKKKMMRGRGRGFGGPRGAFDFSLPRGIRGGRGAPGFGRGFGGPADFGYGGYDPYGNALADSNGNFFVLRDFGRFFRSSIKSAKVSRFA